MYFTVGIAGAAWLDEKNKTTAFNIGREIAKRKYGLVCGGLDGVMEAACKGAASVKNRRPIVAIIPGTNKRAANPYADVIIPTSLGYIRNTLIPISSDVLIAVSGGAGTLSEIAYAWQYGTPIILMGKSGGWAEKLAGSKLDHRRGKFMKTAENVEQAMEMVDELNRTWIKKTGGNRVKR